MTYCATSAVISDAADGGMTWRGFKSVRIIHSLHVLVVTERLSYSVSALYSIALLLVWAWRHRHGV
jgi:hypothetical protein